jgi:hypothetical protein
MDKHPYMIIRDAKESAIEGISQLCQAIAKYS